MRTADAKADLSLRWAHSHFVGFVMSRLNYSVKLYVDGIQHIAHCRIYGL